MIGSWYLLIPVLLPILSGLLLHVVKPLEDPKKRNLFTLCVMVVNVLALLPVLVQASGSFFVKNGTRRLAMKLLKEGKIHLLGSDCHNMGSRAPALDKALEAITKGLGESVIHRINKLEQQVFSGPDFIL
mgnify:CR=1 FL=1